MPRRRAEEFAPARRIVRRTRRAGPMPHATAPMAKHPPGAARTAGFLHPRGRATNPCRERVRTDRPHALAGHFFREPRPFGEETSMRTTTRRDADAQSLPEPAEPRRLRNAARFVVDRMAAAGRTADRPLRAGPRRSGTGLAGAGGRGDHAAVRARGRAHLRAGARRRRLSFPLHRHPLPACGERAGVRGRATSARARCRRPSPSRRSRPSSARPACASRSRRRRSRPACRRRRQTARAPAGTTGTTSAP